MLLRRTQAIAAGLTVLLATPVAAQAANTYVDDDAANNSGNCLTPATACQTMLGAQGAIGKSGPGDTVFVDGGTYNEVTRVDVDGNRSLIYQEFNAPDAPAIIDGGPNPAVGVGSGQTGGTIQGLTLRGAESPASAFGPVRLVGNTFDDGEVGSFSNATVHLQDDTGIFEVINNAFTDPTVADNQTAIRADLDGTSSKVTISGNTINGFRTGIDLLGTSAATDVIADNTITGLHEDSGLLLPGIGVFIQGGSANVTHNRIQQPGFAPIGTLGISAYLNASVTMTRNQVYNQGYGADFTGTTSATLNGDVLANNSIIGLNSAVGGGGGHVNARNVTIWGNTTDISLDETSLTLDSSIVEDPIQESFSTPSTCVITFSRGPTMTPSVFGCQDFQTTAAPAFVDPTTGINNFHLSSGSPMVEAGSTIPPPPGTLDVDGDQRILDGDCNGTARMDMGADELVRDCSPPAPPAATPPPPAKKKKCKKAKKKSASAAKKCKRKKK